MSGRRTSSCDVRSIAFRVYCRDVLRSAVANICFQDVEKTAGALPFGLAASRRRLQWRRRVEANRPLPRNGLLQFPNFSRLLVLSGEERVERRPRFAAAARGPTFTLTFKTISAAAQKQSDKIRSERVLKAKIRVANRSGSSSSSSFSPWIQTADAWRIIQCSAVWYHRQGSSCRVTSAAMADPRLREQCCLPRTIVGPSPATPRR
jgi:hypothetical protein